MALAAAALLRLAQALPLVGNRYAFGWDSARRAVLDMRAGDALRGGHLLDWLGYVAGPETWPTLRLVAASIAHALAGPPQAFTVEHAVSLTTSGAIALAVAYAARAVTVEGSAALVAVIATTLLAGNGALLAHAANGMLEPLSAALTTAAVAAWIVARTSGAPRPWALAVLGNLLFHTKWQHGLLLAIAVLLLEWLAPGEPSSSRASLGASLGALGRTARTRAGQLLLAAALVLGAIAWWIGAKGDSSLQAAGFTIGLRTIHGPVAFGALSASLFVELAFWRERARLRASVPARLRFAWAWLATPMAAWLLVPFTWRLRTILVTSGTYDSGAALTGPSTRLSFYGEAAWHTWMVPQLHLSVMALAVAALAATVLSAPVRRRLLPIAVLAAIEWVLLTLGTRHNYQARFALNLAPLLAVALCSWAGALPARWWSAAIAGVVIVALAIPSLPTWERGRLAASIGAGFDPAENATACRSVMERLPVERAWIVNEAPLSHRQGCSLWATVIARQRGERPGRDGIIILTEATDPEPVPRGYRKIEEVRAGPLRGTLYEQLR